MCYHVSTFDWIKALEREKPVLRIRESKRPRTTNPDPQQELSIFNPKKLLLSSKK